MVTQMPDRLDETVTVRLTATEKKKLREVALQEDRKPAAVVRRFILQALATDTSSNAAQ